MPVKKKTDKYANAPRWVRTVAASYREKALKLATSEEANNYDGTTNKQTNISGLNLTRINLSYEYFENVSLSYSRFVECDLTDISFDSDCDINTSVTFERCILKGRDVLRLIRDNGMLPGQFERCIIDGIEQTDSPIFIHYNGLKPLLITQQRMIVGCQSKTHAEWAALSPYSISYSFDNSYGNAWEKFGPAVKALSSAHNTKSKPAKKLKLRTLRSIAKKKKPKTLVAKKPVIKKTVAKKTRRA